jgi:hypothetical protein
MQNSALPIHSRIKTLSAQLLAPLKGEVIAPSLLGIYVDSHRQSALIRNPGMGTHRDSARCITSNEFPRKASIEQSAPEQAKQNK